MREAWRRMPPDEFRACLFQLLRAVSDVFESDDSSAASQREKTYNRWDAYQTRREKALWASLQSTQD